MNVKPGSQFAHCIDIQTHTVCCVKLEFGSILTLQIRLFKKKTLLAMCSDKLLCSQCTQHTVRVPTSMQCTHCEPGLCVSSE